MDASNTIQNSSAKFLIYSRESELVKAPFKSLIILIQPIIKYDEVAS